MAAKDYINLEMPSIMGMGAVGPTISVLTASIFQAIDSSVKDTPDWIYPLVMFILSGLLAVFPTSKTTYPKWQKFVLWPLAAIVVFSAAWGTNRGLSVGEEVLTGSSVSFSFPSFTSTAYADTTEVFNVKEVHSTGPTTNKVDFSKLDMETKRLVPKGMFDDLPKTVWGLSWTNGTAILKGEDGKWYHYRPKSPDPVPEVPEKPVKPHGGFFKRF